MKYKTIIDRWGRETEIAVISELDSCIIPIDSKNHREDTLDDNMQHWKQWY